MVSSLSLCYLVETLLIMIPTQEEVLFSAVKFLHGAPWYNRHQNIILYRWNRCCSYCSVLSRNFLITEEDQPGVSGGLRGDGSGADSTCKC